VGIATGQAVERTDTAPVDLARGDRIEQALERRAEGAGRTRPAQLSAEPRQENGTICSQSRQLQ
jgi:hypothetical protein